MVATWKTELVDQLATQIKAKKVVGVVGIDGVPSKQMQIIRSKISSDAELVVSRKTIVNRALEKAGIKGMADHVSGTVGVIMSDLNPFKLEKLLDSNKSKAPAKAGAIAPFDLVVPEGDTGLPAGPVIGDLQGAGIKAKIQGGTIKVTEDSTVVKVGEPVPKDVAPVLARLGLEPMEILLKLNAAYEDGIIYTYDILHIDEQKTFAKFCDAATKAFNLSFNARMFTPQTTPLLLAKAVADARNLMINAEIINSETVGIYLARADAQAKALKACLPEELLPQEDAAEDAKPDASADDGSDAKADDASEPEAKAEEGSEAKAEEAKSD